MDFPSSKLVEMVCPVTGRPMETRPDWHLMGPNHVYRIGVIDRRIVVCRSYGHTDREAVQGYNRVVQSILDEFREPGQRMVMLEDYSQLHGSDNGARQEYVAYHLARQEIWSAILFFGMNPFLKMLLRLSRRLNAVRIPVDVRDDYESALREAYALLQLPFPETVPKAPAGGRGWAGEGMRAVFQPLDSRNVFLCELEGRPRAMAMPRLVEALEQFLAEQSPPPGRWYRVIDYRRVSHRNLLAGLRAILSLGRLERLFPSRLRVVVGLPRIWHWIIRIATFFRPSGRTAFVDNPEQLEILLRREVLEPLPWSIRPRAPRWRFWRRRDPMAQTERLMEFLGEILWGSEGRPDNPFPPEHPFHPVANSILVVKGDFDGLIAERDRREADLESARVRAEEARRLQSAFLANVSHEIRTPLNAVIGMGELLSHTPLDENQKDLLTTLRQSAQGSLSVINDILDLSRLQAGEFHLSDLPFDLPAMLGEVGRMMGYLASSRGLEFAVVVPENLPAGVRGDPVRLRQILVNLAGNAVKFTENGRVRLRVGFRDTGDDRIRLSCAVEDTGPGIPPDRIEELFQPFRQLDDGLARRHGGTGLGLAIARNLAERMGGGITVESERGRGSVFTLKVSLILSDDTPNESTHVGEEASGELHGKVLVAEDNRVNQKVITGLLARLGLEAVVVGDGAQALEWLRNCPEGEIGCVLMDVQMPVMDGIEAVSRIRAGEVGEWQSHLPVVALTAHAMEGDREIFLRAGMDEYLSKPLRGSDLRQVLTPLMGTRPG